MIVEVCVRALRCVDVSFGSNVRLDPEPLGALPWVVHCCLF